LNKDGATVPVEIVAEPIQYERRPGLLLIVRDITRRREDDATRQCLESELRQAEKMRTVGTLAAGIAHDFNNILQALFGYLELALADGSSRARRDADLVRALESARRAKHLVDQILTFSRRVDPLRVPSRLVRLSPTHSI